MNDTTDSTRGPSSEVHAPPFDRQHAQTALGSEKLLRKVADLFLGNAPSLIEQISSAIESGDSGKLERAAHTLVSSLAYLWAKSATDSALSLEHSGRSKDLANAKPTFDELHAEYVRLKTALRAFLDEES